MAYSVTVSDHKREARKASLNLARSSYSGCVRVSSGSRDQRRGNIIVASRSSRRK